MSKHFKVLIWLGVVLSISVCLHFIRLNIIDNSYKEGYRKGHQIGFDLGKVTGDSVGFVRGFNVKYSDLKKIEDIFLDLKYKVTPEIEYVTFANSVVSTGAISNETQLDDFSQYMEKVDTAILSYLATNFGIDDNLKNQIFDVYYQSNLDEEIFNELYHLNRNTIYSSGYVYSYKENFDGIKNFEKVLSNHVSNLLGTFTSAFSKSPQSSLFITLLSSSVLPEMMEKPLKPFLTKLKEQAIIKDYLQSTSIIENEIQSQILQLATAEYSGSIIKKKEFHKEVGWFNFDGWLHLHGTSTTKAGFDLAQQFSLTVDNASHKIIVDLPAPQILSHEVDIYIKDLNDEDWFIDIEAGDINDAKNEIKSTLYERAKYSGILSESESNAKTVLKSILYPITTSMPYPYSVVVKFNQDNEDILIDFTDFEFSDSFGY